MCHASEAEYECVFTSGATGGLKLVADAFPWSHASCFAYTRDNHTSVVGMRGTAMKCGAAAVAVDVLGSKGRWRAEPAGPVMRGESGGASQPVKAAVHSLFAFPAESNFCGARYDPGLGSAVQGGGLQVRGGATPRDPAAATTPQGGPPAALEATEGRGGAARTSSRWWVLLDAAKACASKPPDLRQDKPDFVVLSFYKIFGYPTGLGALLVRREARAILHKPFFGGGTVSACAADTHFVRRREGPAGLEDGTLPFLGVAAVPHGFRLIEGLGGFPAIEAHAGAISRMLVDQLTELRHWNGRPVCRIYGWGACLRPAVVGQGPTVALNLLRADGSVVGYREVETVAGLHGILLRGGCFCNPGACAAHLGLSSRDVQDNHRAGHVCWGEVDLVRGRPTGAVRVSFGFASSPRDAKAVTRFICQHFRHGTPPGGGAPGPGGSPPGPFFLAALWVYPIKSCGGCVQQEWALGEGGLLYDREWAVVGEDGEVLTLRKWPCLALIRPTLDLAAGEMRVTAPCMPCPLRVPLACSSPATGGREVRICAHSVCATQAATVMDAGSTAEWFSQAVGCACSLVRQVPGSRQAGRAPGPAAGFANEAQLLAVSQASLDDLNARLRAEQPDVGLMGADRFRPNLLVGGGAALWEDTWRKVEVGGAHFRVTGPCARCEVVCVDSGRGVRNTAEPLRTLASYRRHHSRINFGVLLQRTGCGQTACTHSKLAVGMPVSVVQEAE